MYRDFGFRIPGKLIRCDIDAAQVYLNIQPEVALIGDSKTTALQLAERLQPSVRSGEKRTSAAMDSAMTEFAHEAHCHLRLLQTIQITLPDSIIVGDSTQLIYSGNMVHNTDAPNQWFNSSVGFGTLGYALPAAIGAGIAKKSAIQSDKPSSSSDNANNSSDAASVVCLIGDGGLQFVLGELGTLVDSPASVAIIVWCNNGYREIKTTMENAEVTTVGVDLVVPDFAMIARAYGIDSVSANSMEELSNALLTYLKTGKSVMVVVDEQSLLNSTDCNPA